MGEFYSRAIVLGRSDRGEADSEVSLFTEKYGKIILWAKSIRKLNSKSSAHLQPLRFVQVRWAESRKIDGRLVLLDVLWDDRMKSYYTHKRYDLAPLIQAVNKVCMEFQPEFRIWQLLEMAFTKGYKKSQINRAMLLLLGFHPENERCFVCGKKPVCVFFAKDARFICGACASQSASDEIVLDI